ncbi:MAG: hypothetical protein K2I35_08170 [Duncaniella sp.]|nr:hypothetical protein [Duncaniella sp.]
MKLPKLLLLLSLLVMVCSCKDDDPDYKTYTPLTITVDGLKVETPGEFVKTADIPADGVSFDFTVEFNKDIEPVYEVLVNNKSEYTRENGMNPDVTDKSWGLQLLSGKPDYKYHVEISPNETGETREFKFMLGKGSDYAQIRLTQAK